MVVVVVVVVVAVAFTTGSTAAGQWAMVSATPILSRIKGHRRGAIFVWRRWLASGSRRLPFQQSRFVEVIGVCLAGVRRAIGVCDAPPPLLGPSGPSRSWAVRAAMRSLPGTSRSGIAAARKFAPPVCVGCGCWWDRATDRRCCGDAELLGDGGRTHRRGQSADLRCVDTGRPAFVFPLALGLGNCAPPKIRGAAARLFNAVG